MISTIYIQDFVTTGGVPCRNPAFLEGCNIFKGNAMNWKRGSTRLTVVLSVTWLIVAPLLGWCEVFDMYEPTAAAIWFLPPIIMWLVRLTVPWIQALTTLPLAA